LNPDQAR